MATAVQPTTEPKTQPSPTKLAIASGIGAGVLIGLVIAATIAVESIGSWGALRLAAQVVAILAGGIVLGKIFGDDPPRGLRGGIFLTISALLAAFFIVRTVGIVLEDTAYGQIVALVVLGALLGLTVKFLTSDRAELYATTLEEHGWFHTFNYKRTQGLHARRYTLLGLLLIGWSGVYSLYVHGNLGAGDLDLRIPYALTTSPPDAKWQHLTGDERDWLKAITDGKVVTKERARRLILAVDVEYSGLIVLAAVTLWFSWRAINVPPFADFLIATEAVMNKVSWSSRKRLFQDTIVVLVTVVILTVFLLAVDLFWGWLLSREIVHILPAKTAGEPIDPVHGKKLEW